MLHVHATSLHIRLLQDGDHTRSKVFQMGGPAREIRKEGEILFPLIISFIVLLYSCLKV